MYKQRERRWSVGGRDRERRQGGGRASPGVTHAPGACGGGGFCIHRTPFEEGVNGHKTHITIIAYGEESAARICGADFIKRNFVAAIKGHTVLVDSHSSSRRLHAARNLITPGCSKTNQIAAKNGPAQYIYTQKKLYLYNTHE
jgi:hypothetical protein